MTVAGETNRAKGVGCVYSEPTKSKYSKDAENCSCKSDWIISSTDDKALATSSDITCQIFILPQQRQSETRGNAEKFDVVMRSKERLEQMQLAQRIMLLQFCPYTYFKRVSHLASKCYLFRSDHCHSLRVIELCHAAGVYASFCVARGSLMYWKFWPHCKSNSFNRCVQSFASLPTAIRQAW